MPGWDTYGMQTAGMPKAPRVTRPWIEILPKLRQRINKG